MNLSEQQELLFQFIKDSHGTQDRKYGLGPYWQHPYFVASLVSSLNLSEEGLIEIALCHDLFEDTTVTYHDLLSKLTELKYDPILIRFILSGVESLTDVFTAQTHEHWNRKFRKSWEADRLWKINKHYQTIKYADLILNANDIVAHDHKFAEIYLTEMEQILEGMRLGNIKLLIQAYETLENMKKYLANNNKIIRNFIHIG